MAGSHVRERNKDDRWDVIRLTGLPQPAASSLHPSGHEVNQREEVLDAKARASLTDAQVWIGRNNIRPSHRYGARAAVRVLEGDTVFTP